MFNFNNFSLNPWIVRIMKYFQYGTKEMKLGSQWGSRLLGLNQACSVLRVLPTGLPAHKKLVLLEDMNVPVVAIP